MTPNDTGDPDLGPNRSQNSPLLTSVGVRVNTTVHGRLNSTPGRQLRIEFFSNTACDAGSGEGETYLGFVDTATTDGNGNVSFVAIFAPVPAGRFITATATDLTTVDTSEFSACLAPGQAGFDVSTGPFTTTEANEGRSIDLTFGITSTTFPTANVTVPVSVSDTTEGRLVSPSTLTFEPNPTGPDLVHLIGVDDGIDDDNVPYIVIFGPASSADPNYNGLDPPDVTVTNVDNDDRAAQCGPPAPRPKVNVSVVKLGSGQLRATISVTANPGTQNEIQAIGWTQLTTATVVLDGVGPVQQGQASTFGPLTQSASFVVTRTAGAQSATVQLTVFDVCGAWLTVVGGGPRAS